MKIFFKLTLFALFPLLFSLNLQAADFSISKSKDGARDLIKLKGEIFDGDEVKFRKISAESDYAIISLDSPGGSFYPALKIGKQIRAMSYSTRVDQNSECNSACSFIWLAGQYKYLAKGSRIGFHELIASEPVKHLDSKIKLSYAELGAYYQFIGLSDGVIAYLVDFSEKPIKWLSNENAQIYGVSIFEVE
jgi:hypothetical protein